jgi:glycine/D-amino acid oxidase-like deaminating enzyme
VSEAPLPTRAEVVVIGGGVVGVATAWFLARRGVSVVLLEKGRIAGEQSSRNWGWIRCQGRDPAELPLMCESSRLWEEIAAELDVDIGFRPPARNRSSTSVSEGSHSAPSSVANSGRFSAACPSCMSSPNASYGMPSPVR